MIEFRKIDYSRDLNEIIGLIQKHLDSSFTMDLFRWKHLENPFGRSYGLLALDDDRVVGLRMFMFWEFFNAVDGSTLRAIRPVDTVVDRDYRGQGLFKRLTLKGLEECKEKYDFVFNTPNENSLPGYLKMGWQKTEQVSYIRIAIVNPFKKPIKFENVEKGHIDFEEKHRYHDALTTYRSAAYIKWRYQDSAYKVAYFPEKNLYVSYHVGRKYLIIYEIFGDLKASPTRIFNSLARKTGKSLVYYYKNRIVQKINLPLSLRRKKPVIVTKYIPQEWIRNMDFSLADLEAVF